MTSPGLPKRWLKISSVLALFFFAVSILNETPRLEAAREILGTVPEGTVPKIFSGLPQEVCEVQDQWVAPQNANQPAGPFPLVILLQEVHVNPLAQKNIARTLEHFEKKFKALGLGEEVTIALEGSSPERAIDPVVFRTFPVPVIRRDVSESFLRAGKIDAADFYAINSNPNAKLFGIEDEKLYSRNLAAYRRFLPDQKESLEMLAEARAALEKLKRKVYSKPLRDLDESLRRLSGDFNTLPLHLALLVQLAKLVRMDLARYPELASALSLSPKGGEGKVRGFLEQMNRLESALFSKLARSRDEKTLVFADQALGLLEKLASLGMTENDFGLLQAKWSTFQGKDFLEKLDDLLHRRGIPFRFLDRIQPLLEKLKPARAFYEFARKRDRALAHNLDRLIKRRKQKIIFVVAGGFHTEGLTASLRRRGISHWTLFPKPDTAWDEAPYWKLLQNALKPPKPEISVDALLLLNFTVLFREPAVVAKALGMAGQAPSPEVLFQNVVREHAIALRQRWVATQDPVAREQFQILRQVDDDILAKRRNGKPFFSNPYPVKTNGTFCFVYVEGGPWKPAVIPPQMTVLHELEPNGIGYKLLIAAVKAPEPPKAPSVFEIDLGSGATGPQPAAFPPTADQNAAYAGEFEKRLAGTGAFSDASKIAQGAMGFVFRATQNLANGSTRIVAIKTIQPRWLSEKQILGRFKREARAMEKAQSTKGPAEHHLTRSYGLGELDMGKPYGKVPYLVMEFVNAKNIEDLLNQAPETEVAVEGALGTKMETLRQIPHTLAIQLIHRIAAALHAFHEENLVHRDIKPANIGLTKVGRAERGTLRPFPIDMGEFHGDFIPKLLDLGLVKELKGSQDDAGGTASISITTEDGEVMGTPAFMAPEQAMDSKLVDRRADIYSLGASLFQMITGRLPIPWDKDKQPNFISFGIKLADPLWHEQTLEKSLKLLDGLGLSPMQTARLKAIFRKALRSQPQDRYQTAEAFAQDLRVFLHKEEKERMTVASKSLSMEAGAMQDDALRARGTRWVRMHKRSVFLAAITAVALAVAGLVVAAFWARGKADRPRSGPEIENEVDPVIENGPDPERAARENLIRFRQEAQAVIPEPALLLRTEEIAQGIARARDLIASPFFPQLPAIERAKIRMNLADLLRRPGPSTQYDPAQSRIEYARAAQEFSRAYAEARTADQKVEALWLKAQSESNGGAYETSNQTLAELKRDFPSFRERLIEADFLMAQNLIVSGGYEDTNYTQARQIYTQYLNDDLDDLVNLRARLGILDAYLLEFTSVSTQIRILSEKSRFSRATQEDQQLATSLIALRLRLGEVIHASISSANVRENDFFVWADGRLYEYIRTQFARAGREEMTSEDQMRLTLALKFWFNNCLFTDSDIATRGTIEIARSDIAADRAGHEGLMNLTRNIRPEFLFRFEPFLTASQVIRVDMEAAISPELKNESTTLPSTRGLILFAEVVRDRRLAILGGQEFPRHAIVADPALMRRAGELFRRAAPPLYGDPVYRRLAEIYASEAERISEISGNSLGVAKDSSASGGYYSPLERGGAKRRGVSNVKVTHPVAFGDTPLKRGIKTSSKGGASEQPQKKLTPLVMEFNRGVLEQFLDRKTDVRKDESQGVLFLVPSAAHMRRLKNEYGKFLRDRQIYLIPWGIPLRRTRLGDLENLLGRAMAQIGPQLFPGGKVKRLEPDQAVFIHDAFEYAWGKNILRIKYRRDRFRDETYRSAILTVAWYGLDHPAEWKDLFLFSQAGHSYELLDEAFKSKKLLSASA